ncbi:hypothetical protein AKJ09_07426 [Labilithrix luteola]|uniref:Uncharacterized protein n=1 Tax=Labilithrix luteola TaxID=1391654 RepID=A0A0K1Q4W0_9BACT|nr:hypothetical protein AKJ09_07426 [Labilithrix luteola]
MKSTFWSPAFARTGSGHAGDDSPKVRPITPGNVVPGSYSTISSSFEAPPCVPFVPRFTPWATSWFDSPRRSGFGFVEVGKQQTFLRSCDRSRVALDVAQDRGASDR